jgi:hypothetical protein
MTTHRLLLISVLSLSACAATTTAATQPDLSQYSDSQFASEQLCEHAISNFERQDFLSTTTPVGEKDLFNRTAFDLRHRGRVSTCTIKLTQRQAACIATAPSAQYIRNCSRFAELQ